MESQLINTVETIQELKDVQEDGRRFWMSLKELIKIPGNIMEPVGVQTPDLSVALDMTDRSQLVIPLRLKCLKATTSLDLSKELSVKLLMASHSSKSSNQTPFMKLTSHVSSGMEQLVLETTDQLCNLIAIAKVSTCSRESMETQKSTKCDLDSQ